MITPWLGWAEKLQANSSFNSASWTKTNASVTADSTVAPDGTTTADTLNDADAVNSGIVSQTVTIAADLLTDLVSVYLKAGTATVCSIRAILTGGVASNYGIAFNPTSGLYTRADSIASAPSQVGVQALPSGWWRITFPVPNNNDTSLGVEIRPAYAAALAGSGLGVTTALDATRTGTAIAWLASAKDSFIPTYPPVGKNLAPELDAVRQDSVTSSGIQQSVTERVDQYQDYTFPAVPPADMSTWSTIMTNILGGGPLTWFPDSTDLSTMADWLSADMTWVPKMGIKNMATFKLRLRQAVAG